MVDIPTEDVNFHDLRSLWLGLHISGGHIGLPITVLTFLVARHLRLNSSVWHPTLINFCVSWVVYSVVYCLTLYGGDSYSDGREVSQNPSTLCYFQTAVTHGAPPMAAVAGLLLVTQLLLAQKQTSLDKLTRWRWVNILLIWTPPYIALALFSLITVLVVAVEKVPVEYTNGFYCTIEDMTSPIGPTVPLFCAFVLMVIIGVETAIWVNWFKRRRTVTELCPLHESNSFTTSLAIRTVLFTIYCLITLCACVVFFSNNLGATRTSFPYMVQASLPLVAFLVFATQQDILRVWLYPFLRRNEGLQRLPSRQNSFQTTTDIPSARPKAGLRASTLSFITIVSFKSSESDGDIEKGNVWNDKFTSESRGV